MNLEIIYTKHVLERMRFRGIEKRDIETALRDPESIQSQGDIRVNQTTIKGKLLRVFYRKDKDKYIIITSYFTYKRKYHGGPLDADKI